MTHYQLERSNQPQKRENRRQITENLRQFQQFNSIRPIFTENHLKVDKRFRRLKLNRLTKDAIKYNFIFKLGMGETSPGWVGGGGPSIQENPDLILHSNLIY